MEKIIISNFLKIHFWKKIIIHFVNLETDPRLRYCLLFFFFPWLPIQGVSGDAQRHFGAAHYRLHMLLCTFWACKKEEIENERNKHTIFWRFHVCFFFGDCQNVKNKIKGNILLPYIFWWKNCQISKKKFKIYFPPHLDLDFYSISI
jgi:hypothetical protein